MSIVNSNNFLHKTVDGVKQFFSPLVNAATVVLKDGTRLEKDGRIHADTADDSEKLGGKAPEAYVKTEDVLTYEEIQASTDLTGKLPSAQALADGLSSVMIGANYIQKGSVSCSVGANSAGSVKITYPKAMSSAPKSIHTQILSSTPDQRLASNTDGSSTSFTIHFINNTSQSATLWAYWTAIW